MPGQPKPPGAVVKWAGLTAAGSGGLGSVVTLFFTGAHGSSPAVALIMGIVIAFAVLIATLPSIIDAIGNKCVAVINAKADAQVTVEQARQRTDLMSAGLTGELDAAISLLRLQPFDAKVVADPQCGDDIRRLLLPEQRNPDGSTTRLTEPKPHRGARTPTRGAAPIA